MYDQLGLNTYDAIVISSGISGGWAAKELCEKGLKVLMLERGKQLEHIRDYTTATKAPWEVQHRGAITNTQKNYIPRFRNAGADKRSYLRGFGYTGYSNRSGWFRGIAEPGIGDEVTSINDAWGQPVLQLNCEFKDNERQMQKDMDQDAVAMLEAAGLKEVRPFNRISYPGVAIHEMGTARMGKDPRTSVLNEWNQVHSAKNVFVTDGACMTSSAC